MAVAPVIRPFTPISAQLEALDRTLGRPTAEADPEQLADYLEAQDDRRETQRKPTGRDIWLGAGQGAAVGGLAGLAKVAPLTAAGVIPTGAAPWYTMGALTALGAGAGAGVTWLQGLGRDRRRSTARQTIADTPPEIVRALRDPGVHRTGEAYKRSLRYPTYGVEAGLTLGGIAGAAAGAALGDPNGTPSAPVFGYQTGLSSDQYRKSLLGSVAGAAGAGAIGILAGILMRHQRRQALLRAGRGKLQA